MTSELLDGFLPGIDPDTLHNADPLPLGQPVVVTNPGIYCDVARGMKGKVVCTYVGGYGVELEANWSDPHTNGRTNIFGNRTLWFTRDNLTKQQNG